MRLSVQGKPSAALRAPLIGRVTFHPVSIEDRGDHVLVGERLAGTDVAGYAALLVAQKLSAEALISPVPIIHDVGHLDHLAEGDVVALNPTGYVRTLYRLASPHNALFATDRCNSFCLMCSQPPKQIDDRDRVTEHLRLIDLMSPDTAELGITGGEPTLLKDDLLEVVRRSKERLPRTALHILSNGRLFYYGSFARELAEIGHPDLMIGIPLYSDIDFQHDYVVQCRGAFDDTMIGLHNLARFGVRVEVRVVIHRLTFERLPQLVEFVYRNVPFAPHVALMGLETIGFAVPNLDRLWVDPWDYREALEEAIEFLASRGMSVSLYNHQLCTVPKRLWRYSRKSISDWKNEYLPECGECSVRERCGGFFASAIRQRHSIHICPVTNDQAV